MGLFIDVELTYLWNDVKMLILSMRIVSKGVKMKIHVEPFPIRNKARRCRLKIIMTLVTVLQTAAFWCATVCVRGAFIGELFYLCLLIVCIAIDIICAVGALLIKRAFSDPFYSAFADAIDWDSLEIEAARDLYGVLSQASSDIRKKGKIFLYTDESGDAPVDEIRLGYIKALNVMELRTSRELEALLIKYSIEHGLPMLVPKEIKIIPCMIGQLLVSPVAIIVWAVSCFHKNKSMDG